MSAVERSWQSRGWLACALWPVSLIYRVLLRIRRLAYDTGLINVRVLPLPVVVVGNLSVGGTGKTPLCALLVDRFRESDWKPAIVSRGYGGARHEQPHLLSAEDTAATAGDEPVMLYRQTGVPVCVCIDRAAAVEHLAENTDASLVFSDDGLQHLAMARVADIVVIDGARGLGNCWLLPAGPLRESLGELAKADLIAIQMPYAGYSQGAAASLHNSLTSGYVGRVLQGASNQTFQLLPTELVSLSSGQTSALETLQGQRIHAVAGIGHPQRFFDSLQALGLLVEAHPLPDHHDFTLTDLAFDDDAPILVTAKDAVKLRALSDLPVQLFEVRTRVHLSNELDAAIDRLERSLRV